MSEPISVFERALGPDLDRLPPVIRAAHTGLPSLLQGRVEIETGPHPLARLAARLFGFPPSGVHEASIRIAADRAGETWIRRFGPSRLRSRVAVGAGPGRIEEAMRGVTFELGISAREGGFDLRVLGWRIGPVRLPRRWAPRAPARISADRSGAYRFDIGITMPGLGLVVRYRGALALARADNRPTVGHASEGIPA